MYSTIFACMVRQFLAAVQSFIFLFKLQLCQCISYTRNLRCQFQSPQTVDLNIKNLVRITKTQGLPTKWWFIGYETNNIEQSPLTWLEVMRPWSCWEAWVWLWDGRVKSVNSNSDPWVSAPIRSDSSGSKNVSVWELGPYASTLIFLQIYFKEFQAKQSKRNSYTIKRTSHSSRAITIKLLQDIRRNMKNRHVSTWFVFVYMLA